MGTWIASALLRIRARGENGNETFTRYPRPSAAPPNDALLDHLRLSRRLRRLWVEVMSELLYTLYDDGYVIKLEGAEVYSILSRSTPDLLHKVTHWRGSWDCSCIGYRNHQHCYHIDEVRKAVSD